MKKEQEMKSITIKITDPVLIGQMESMISEEGDGDYSLQLKEAINLLRDLISCTENIDPKKIDIPSHIKKSLMGYVNKIPTGNFLRAVLSNNLFEAVAYADQHNMSLIPMIMGYVYNELPMDCWGSAEKVRDWLKR